ncbi:PPOX class F420-dependent oxidoreductase [Microbispora sp. H13382]|uniref:PPOX class F420-dependent oxidoreductase n=1 Tax=Microbispora sp. H13382 TaxID=2729112 RepID=UPI001600AF8F|nr:PPOX class F420-dependent oxidoreductase [Microbispora sp. H13382]
MIFTEREIEYLDSQRIGRLATLQPDGTLQVSPVGFRYNRELRTIDIGGRDMAASRKFRNVLANGKVAFVVDDVPSVDPWQVRCLEIRGWGEAIAEPADSVAPTPGPIIRVHPKRIISFGVDPGNPASGKRDVPSR